MYLLVSSILKSKLILLSKIFSTTLALIVSYWSKTAILSISFKILSTEFIEYGSFSNSLNLSTSLLKLEISKSIGKLSSNLPK